MGYTHYWYYNPEKAGSDKNEAFAKATEAIRRYKSFLEDRGLVVRGPDGEGVAFLNKTEVAYNGDGAQGLDHESFCVERDNQAERGGFAFCKTARKPYDTLVCLSLISFLEAFGDKAVFSYCSDGGDEDWGEAYDIYREVSGKRPPSLEDAAPSESNL
jgi:hypothetical protein